MSYLTDLLKDALIPNFHVNDAPGTGGGGMAVVETKDPPAKEDADKGTSAEPEYDLPDIDGVSDEAKKDIVEKDPELKERLVAKKTAKKSIEAARLAKEKKNKPGTEVDHKEDAGAVKDDKTEKADDADSGEVQSGDIEFADNVIEGLSGKDFKAIPEAAQVAIAKFHEVHTELKTKHGEVETRLNTLLADPIVKNRIEMLESGVSQYSDEGMNDDERATISKKIQDKYGLDATEAAGIIADLEEGLDEVIKGKMESERQNYIIQHDRQQKASDVNKKGEELILSLAQFNPELAVKEKDIMKFYTVNADGKTVYDEKHPEIAKFKKGLGAIQEFCVKLGIRYDTALEMGAESLYGLAAPKLGLPVAFNTKDRDKKIAATVRNAALKPFVKSSGDRALSESTNAAPDKKRVPEGDVEEAGYNLKQLNTDPKYYAKCCENVPKGVNPTDHLAKISELAKKGRQMIRAEKQKQ